MNNIITLKNKKFFIGRFRKKALKYKYTLDGSSVLYIKNKQPKIGMQITSYHHTCLITKYSVFDDMYLASISLGISYSFVLFAVINKKLKIGQIIVL